MRRNSYVRRRISQSGVAEVVGTILILAMTVVLFATIIIWVASIPTPQASIRLDMDGTLTPFFDTGGTWDGVNITVRHRGGETLFAFRTQTIFTVQKPDNSFQTTVLRNRGTEFGIAYGIDGPDEDWHTGETWRYTNNSVDAEDRVTITVIDSVRSLILWNEPLKGPEGVHPPLFLEKWADRLPNTPTINVPQTNREFTIFARVADQDGDLIRHSVYVYLAFLFGSPEHRAPQRMYDDGTNGDAIANDGVFTAKYSFFRPSSLSWDGGVIIFNATDLKGHKTTSRMTLEVVEGPPGTQRRPGGFETGRPPNLNYNGLQGFNVFNATEWDSEGFNATETRVFKESEEVVVVVGSAILTDTFGRNVFKLYDPFSKLPLDPVVYGTDKRVTASSRPSSTEAFSFFIYENGYNLFILRFELNNASSVGINFAKVPSRPPQYFFASYPLEIDIIDFLGNRFSTTDTITITANDGTVRNFPKLDTYKDSAFTQKTNEFRTTEVVYVAITMQTVDTDINRVFVGNVVIQDFKGGLQVFRAPRNGREANPPICPVNVLTCQDTPPPVAISSHQGTVTYRFAINLTLANQDPWVDGTQHYSLRVVTLRDTDEEYSLVLSAQLVLTAPLYRMDIIAGVGDTQNNAWGTHDVSYYWLALNGVDLWRQERIHSGADKTIDLTRAVSYLDFDADGDLDVVASVTFGANQPSLIHLYRQDRGTGDEIIWTRSTIEVTGNVMVTDIRTGSLNKDVAPEIVVGANNGHVWYYANDGSWTKTIIDTSRAGVVNAVDLGDFDGDGDLDVVVARNGGVVTYYPNLDGNGRFTTGEQTDRWYAEFEQTVRGTRTGDYTATFTADDAREGLLEEVVNLPAVSGSTANADFAAPNVDGGGATNWTFAGWTGYNPGSAAGHKHTTGGNPTHHYSLHMACVRGGQVGGFIEQPFTITVQGVTATFHLDWRVSDFGTIANNVQVYAFIGTASGAPTPGSATQVWTSGQLTGTTGWSGTPMVNVDVSSRVQQPGTYYLKIGAITTNNNPPCGTETVALLDNAKVFWNRAAGDSSRLVHYYRLQQLPNRPGSTYTFVVEAQRTDNTQNDNFVFGYSTTGQFGAYTNMTFRVNTNTDTRYSEVLPAMPGAVVWLRVMDTDLALGNTSREELRVDEMYLQVFTPGGVTGSDINLPSGPGNAIVLDAGDYNGDRFDDVFVGTSTGNVYRLRGSGGGLQAPAGTFLTGLGTIGGVKLGNVTTAVAGLELAVASNTVVRVYNSETAALLSTTAAVPNGRTITTLSMGDIDGDGDDDLLVGTTGTNNAAANLVYYRNNPSGWGTILVNDQVFNTIYDTDLGDMSKSQYRGR